ncbi:MAG: transcriptional repressor [Chloroflexi bacterium]|nr:transcriptional repressor [Chloroflexota bacterium]
MTQSLTLHKDLRQNHRKLTRARQAVLAIVTDAQRHLTPAEIYRKAKIKYPHLGLTTVYRTLDLLAELGYIQRVHAVEGCHSYAPTAQTHGHHLVCATCGRAEEFTDCDLESLIQSLQVRTGFEINVHMLELMGRCPDCRAPARARKRKTPRGKA